MKFRRLACLILLLGSTILAFSQHAAMPEIVADRSHPVSIKTDLLGFRSQLLSVEAEILILRRLSAFAQVGIIQGFRHDSQWRSHGYLGRAGVKFYLGSKEAPRMTGFALKAEAATRTWKSYGDKKTHDLKEVAGFLGISYSWSPFDRLVVEPCLGVGLSSWSEYFSTPSILDTYSGIPNSPWVQPGKFFRGDGVYDRNGNLVALSGAAWQINIGLLIGIRL